MSLNISDLVIILIFLYFFYSGWSRGFLRSLTGPIALILCLFVGYQYYGRTQNIGIALAIMLVGPVVLRWLVFSVLNLMSKAEGEEVQISTPDRLLGVVVNLAWGGGLLVIFLIVLTMFPLNFLGLNKVQENLNASYSMQLISSHIPFPRFELVEPDTDALAGSQPGVGVPSQAMVERMEKIKETREFQELMNDPRIRELLEDEAMRVHLQKKNIPEILADPRIKEVLYDPEMIRKFLQVYQQMQSVQTEGTNTPVPREL